MTASVSSFSILQGLAAASTSVPLTPWDIGRADISFPRSGHALACCLDFFRPLARRSMDSANVRVPFYHVGGRIG